MNSVTDSSIIGTEEYDWPYPFYSTYFMFSLKFNLFTIGEVLTWNLILMLSWGNFGFCIILTRYSLLRLVPKFMTEFLFYKTIGNTDNGMFNHQT